MLSRNNVSLRGKNILGLEYFSAEEINLVLDTAKEMKNIIHRDIKPQNILIKDDATVTITDFGIAVASIVKGESLRNTLLTLEDMGVDAIIMRHSAEGAAEYATKVVSPVIINAGDGAHAHPSQGLLNLFTIRQHKGKLAGLKVAVIGDILHSRVARSDIWGMRKMGMEVHLAGPKTLLPRFLQDEPGIFVHDRVEDAIADADVINVLRIQLERMKSGLFPSLREYARIFGLNKERLALAKDDVLVLHPGPMNKGVEISPEIAYGANSAIQDQVQNGVAVRMALLTLTLTGGKNNEITD